MKISCIHKLIEQYAADVPSKPAVCFQEKFLTYETLNNKANQLAHYLKFLGVTFNTPVAICIHRSLEMIIGILGILKAGGTYVPIDPHYPLYKINFILNDAKASFLITEESLLNKLPHITQIICLDRDKEIITAQSTDNLNLIFDFNSLAYILYTSGTTGTPKGVMITHANLINAYFGWEKIYRLHEEANCHLQMANFTFDVFSGDLIRALCSGGKLILCEKEIILNPKQLYEFMLKNQINCAEFVPAVLRKLITHLEMIDGTLNFMRVLICGSDSWTMGEYKKFKKFCGVKTRLINSYGMTEATIDSTYFEAATDITAFADESLVPIGRPFPNIELYLLDENLKPVSKGNIGEIYISGAGLARGYLNQSELTQQKFISHPFNEKSNALLYKTGDLGRYLPDGNIELLGRIDNQIKIRGHRIEPNAIESILNQHPSIQESVVLNCKNGEHDILTAFIIIHPHTQISHQELRCFLEKYLPIYMIPSSYKVIKNFPLTANGKIDRNALATHKCRALKTHYMAPKTPLEKQLAKSWSKFLGLKKIGIYDNFFDLGGNSLLLTQILAKLENYDALKDKIPDIIANPTITNITTLAAQLRSNNKEPILQNNLFTDINVGILR